ncbi:hypothetical protein [Ruminococcus flavefaciens]|uniref:hypothetical protein n=1 Tax=Ruminococcus flavefaciens TaxID=1265 RepID=UPI0026E9AD34|nr:hypothetical protein [Ruminococcus flavefaciens]MDD7515308.1 hypothetical protein [Ruminococcus flavefaciens]MDY5692583.1 hypothetical protein [Ruminococcus flavefaciens]
MDWKGLIPEDVKKNAQSYLDKLIQNSEILSEICCVSESLDDAVRQVKEYSEKADRNSKRYGRVWLLVGTAENGRNICLTAGQHEEIKNDDIFKEIIGNIAKMSVESADKRSYYSLRINYSPLTFYEADVDKYIETVLGKVHRADGNENIVNVMFDMAKEYLAEAALAFYTNAEYWNYFGSGMDKRAFNYLSDEYKSRNGDDSQ